MNPQMTITEISTGPKIDLEDATGDSVKFDGGSDVVGSEKIR